ncbi:MAG: thiamine pyrophosphate-binding protein [Akkermansiaceae bacterium]|nr:thiamine pyrophosphate-binding protein [Akkermansiaceae bacterium]
MNAWRKAEETVRDCLAAGIAEFVVCAGARNAALVEALARAEVAGRARLWRHFEERSAGFFALGRTQRSGQPCAVVTTSGTAVAELLPAVIEAFYQNRPLVALTADRPAEFRGTGAPQAIDQTGIFGSHAQDGGISTWDGRGPLHLNVELDESFAPDTEETPWGEPAAFTPARDRIDVAALARWLREDHYLGFTVMIGGLEPDEREEVFHFCRDFGAPVVAEATSGLREALQGVRRGKSCASARCRAGDSGAIWKRCRMWRCGRSAATACPGWRARRKSPAARWTVCCARLVRSKRRTTRLICSSARQAVPPASMSC